MTSFSRKYSVDLRKIDDQLFKIIVFVLNLVRLINDIDESYKDQHFLALILYTSYAFFQNNKINNYEQRSGFKKSITAIKSQIYTVYTTFSSDKCISSGKSTLNYTKRNIVRHTIFYSKFNIISQFHIYGTSKIFLIYYTIALYFKSIFTIVSSAYITLK